MKIQLLGWESSGLRCPDFKIDLCFSGRVPRVALLQMPNGTGKTTTLDCLRASLDGSAAYWTENRVREFRPPGSEETSGSFVVHLLVNGTNRLSFEMTFYFEEGIVAYRTTSGQAQRDGFTPPPEVRIFLHESFSKLFIFDGELAARLLKDQGEDAGAVIDKFYQLYLLSELESLAQQLLTDHTRRRAQKNPNHAKIDALNREVAALEKKLFDLQGKARDFQRQSEVLKEKIRVTEIEAKTRVAKHRDFRDREQQAEAAFVDAGHRLELALQSLGSLLSNPCFVHPAFEAGLQRLAGSLERLKLPESSKAFFIELAGEPTCVCGRPLEEEHRHEIRRRSEHILGGDIADFLNAFKGEIQQLTAPTDERSLSVVVSDLRAISQERDDAQMQKNQIREQLAASGDEALAQLQADLSKINAEVLKIEEFMENFNREPLPSDRVESGCEKWFVRVIASKRNQLADLTGSLEFKARTDVLCHVLQSAYKTAHRALKTQVVEAANLRLAEALAYNPVRIADIDKTIRLSNEQGDVQGGASQGQSLAIGYVFLTTILSGSAHQFPLVVDSPAGANDRKVRREIGKLVPQLCEQFVAFTISTEREGFIEPLSKAAQDDVKFLTGFRRSPGTEPLLADLPAGSYVQSENGVLVEGREYFMTFDVEKTD